jgi:hypothetical protein
MRFGHCKTPAHLHKLKIVPTASCCYCDEENADLDHLLLKCPRFKLHRLILAGELCDLSEDSNKSSEVNNQSVSADINLVEILSDKKFFKPLYKYIINSIEKV